MTDDCLTVLSCHNCANVHRTGERVWCPSCACTGSIFWVEGRSYPYTPDGEKRARAALKSAERET